MNCRVYASNSKGRSKVEMIRSQTSPFQVAIAKLFSKFPIYPLIICSYLALYTHLVLNKEFLIL
jgi:hypothetical protein